MSAALGAPYPPADVGPAITARAEKAEPVSGPELRRPRPRERRPDDDVSRWRPCAACGIPVHPHRAGCPTCGHLIAPDPALDETPEEPRP